MLKFTVIMVCFNDKDRVKKTIESVLSQTYSNVEFLIIDGDSSDGTADILKKYSIFPKVNIFSEKDRGIYNAMNRGITRASGDYIFFLNAGDLFYDNHVLENAAAYMINDTTAIYYGNICSIYPDGSCITSDYSGLEQRLVQSLFNGEMPCHQSVFAPGKTLVNHYFREQYSIRADFEWLVSSVGRQVKCTYMPLIISCYDMSGVSGAAKNRRQFQLETQEILREHVHHFGNEALSDGKDEMILNWKNSSDKHFLLYQTANNWLALKQRGLEFSSYFQRKGYHRIAVYGMGYLGQRLYDELKDSAISIVYGVDRNAQNLKCGIPVYQPDQVLWEVDAVVVTAVTYFSEVKEQISKKALCKIISLEDIVYEILSEIKET